MAKKEVFAFDNFACDMMSEQEEEEEGVEIMSLAEEEREGDSGDEDENMMEEEDRGDRMTSVESDSSIGFMNRK